MGTHEDQYIYMIIPRYIPFRTRDVLGRSSRENKKTHFMFNNFYLLKIVSFMR
jgi:hypothetical protein